MTSANGSAAAVVAVTLMTFDKQSYGSRIVVVTAALEDRYAVRSVAGKLIPLCSL